MNKRKDCELSLHVDLKEEDRGSFKDTLVCNDQFDWRKKAEGEAFCQVVLMWQEMRKKYLKSQISEALRILMRVKEQAAGGR